MSTQPLDPHRWRALAVVGAAFFMTVLDVTVVNVALPSIGTDLGFERETLQWVITAYAITFGGFLLLAGRADDLLGRRMLFMVGVALFTVASLACGLSSSDTVLIAARAVQGLGAAIVSPAALAIVGVAFAEGSERNKALGIWGAIGGSGGAAGVLLGGILTKYLGWEWIFFVNVPVGAAILVMSIPFVRESRMPTDRRRFDPLGALAVTGSLVLLVYGISEAPSVGWGSARTILVLAAAAALLALFVAVESRIQGPLVPFRIFRLRNVTGANILGLMVGASVVSIFFLLTLYVQQVLGYSALQTGLAFLAVAGTSILAAGPAEMLVTRIGPKAVMAIGLALLAASLFWYTQIDVDGRFVVDLLPGYIATGVGIAFSFVPISVAALAHVEERDEGLASGLINTTQQLGAALGVALVSTLFTTRATNLLEEGTPPPQALTEGFQLAFWVIGAIAAVGFLGVLAVLLGVHIPSHPEAVPGHRLHPWSQFTLHRHAVRTITGQPTESRLEVAESSQQRERTDST